MEFWPIFYIFHRWRPYLYSKRGCFGVGLVMSIFLLFTLGSTFIHRPIRQRRRKSETKLPPTSPFLKYSTPKPRSCGQSVKFRGFEKVICWQCWQGARERLSKVESNFTCVAAWATWPPWHGTRLQGLISIPGQTQIQTQTRPSMLGMTHQMGHKKITGSV